MDEKEWDRSDPSYRGEALLALRSLILLEDQERSAQAFAGRPWMFFVNERALGSKIIEAPMGTMISHCSRDFCSGWARGLLLDEAGWEALRLGVEKMSTQGKDGPGMSFAGWKSGRNLDAMLEGLDANSSAPQGFGSRLRRDMMETLWRESRDGGWGLVGEESERWAQEWLARARRQRDASGKPAGLEGGLRALGRHWDDIARLALDDEESALADRARAMAAMEGAASAAQKEGLASGEDVDSVARDKVAWTLGLSAQKNKKRLEGAQEVFAKASEATWRMAMAKLGTRPGREMEWSQSQAVALLETMLLRKQVDEAARQAPRRGAPSL